MAKDTIRECISSEECLEILKRKVIPNVGQFSTQTPKWSFLGKEWPLFCVQIKDQQAWFDSSWLTVTGYRLARVVRVLFIQFWASPKNIILLKTISHLYLITQCLWQCWQTVSNRFKLAQAESLDQQRHLSGHDTKICGLMIWIELCPSKIRILEVLTFKCKDNRKILIKFK